MEEEGEDVAAQVALIALLILTQGVLLRPIQPSLLNSQVTKG